MSFNAVILTDALLGERLRPMGAYRIADELRNAGYTSLVIDMISKISNEELFELIDKTVSDDTLFVGWSSTFFLDINNPSYVTPFKSGEDLFIRINKYLKDKFPKIKILYGGAAAYTLLRQVRTETNYYVDYIIRGMSEQTVLDVVENIKNNEIPKHIEQIGNVYDVSYDMAGDRYDFRHHTHYWHESDQLVEGETLPLEVARGCIFKCAFCTFPLLGKHKNDNTYIRHEDNVLAEILHNYDLNKTLTYVITDDTFNERTDKIEMMLRIRDKSKLNLNFVGYNRLDLIGAKPEQMRLLRDLNFNGHFFGIDTMNPESAKAVGKSSQPEKLIETLYKLKDVYDETHTPMIIQAAYIAGLPYETPDSVSYWVGRLMDKTSPVNAISIHSLQMNESSFGKSDIHTNPEKFGYKLHDDKFGQKRGEARWWENSIWNQTEADKLASQLKSDLYLSERQQVTGWLAAGMSRFGYSYGEFFGMSAKVFEENYRPKMNQLVEEDKNLYFKKLKQYLNF